MATIDTSIISKIKSASAKDITEHLLTCDKQFIPPLSHKIDISEYAIKLFERSVTFEAWIGARLIGLVASYFNKEQHFGFITNVSVLPLYLGKGIAQRLMDQCLHYGQKEQMKEMRLEVSVSNKPAIHLYQKYGFKVNELKGDTQLMVLHFGNQA